MYFAPPPFTSGRVCVIIYEIRFDDSLMMQRLQRRKYMDIKKILSESTSILGVSGQEACVAA